MPLWVLVPYDGSEQSRLAVDHAFERFAADEITILHVIEPFPDHSKAAGYPGDRHARVFRERQQLVGEVVPTGRDETDGVRTELIYGRPVAEIPRFIETNGIDEVVMGSRGLDGLSTVLLGSVSQAVVRKSPVPVTVIRPSDETEDNDQTGTQSILVPFDGSARSRSALAYACEQVRDATITVLFVSEGTTAEHGHLETEDDLGEIVARSNPEDDHESQRLRSASTRIADKYGREISSVFAAGDAANETLAWARQHEIDHIVIGRKGRGKLKGLLSGSLAEVVVRRAPVSITVVP